MSNLQTLCKKCHEKKTGRPLYDWREGKKQFSRSSHTEFATPNRTSFNKPIEEAQLSTERAIWEAEKEIRAAERERLRILLDPTLQGYGSPNRKSTEAEASPSSYPVDSIMGEPFSQKMLPEKNRHAEQPILDQDNIDTTKLSILALGAQITPLTKYLVVLLLTIFGTLCILSFANYWTSFANAR